jgi:hypothetical protein
MASEPADKLKVFVSSVQNKEVEDLGTERGVVVDAVRRYSPTAPWAFEHTPASDLPAQEYYLRGVQDCQLFMLILGGSVTDAVIQEYNTAISCKKFIFVFIKDVQRTEAAEQLLNLIRKQSKYATFKNQLDLPDLVVSSLNGFFRRLVEDHQLQKEYPEVMKALADSGSASMLVEYARQLFAQSTTSLEAEVTHYLSLVPASARDASKFYISMKAKLPWGAAETIDDILAKHKRVVILGLAGSGKTTELLNFSLRLSQLAIEGRGDRQIPIYIDMKGWVEGDIISHLKSLFGGYGFHFEKPTLESMLKNYTTVLLFDGLDEVPPSELSWKVNQIKSIAKTYEKARILVSCRPAAYTWDLGFPIACLEPLQDADIMKYMAEFTNEEFNIGRFYSWPTSLRELSRHPLMLGFIANIIAEGVEPATLSDVYEKYIDFLFTKWEVQKGAKIDPVWKRKAVAAFAIYMQRQSRYSILEDDAIREIRSVISGEHVDFSSVELLNELVSSGLIKKRGKEFTFWHASLREFLASQLLISRIREGKTISELVSDPAWEPVVLFASGILKDGSEMSAFLFEVLKVDLYLYARCLANSTYNQSSSSALPDNDLTLLILGEMLEVRSRIVERWLPALRDALVSNVSLGQGPKPAIIGSFSSEGGGHIVYGYSTEERLGKKLRLIGEFPEGTTFNSLLKVGIVSSVTSRGLPFGEAGIVGAHRIALEDIWKEVEEIIRAKSLLEPPRLIYERALSEVTSLARNHILSVTLPAGIPLVRTEVSKLVARYGTNQVLLRVEAHDIYLDALARGLEILDNSGYASIGPPLLPKHDRIPIGSNWVTQFYRDETLVDYVNKYFQNVLDGYTELVKLNFIKLASRLGNFQLLPVRVMAEITRPAPSKDMESLGGCDYYFEPLENGVGNEVSVILNPKTSSFMTSSDFESATDRWIQKLKRYGRWNSTVHVSYCRASLGGFFGERGQIRESVYEWALEDLRRIFEIRGFRL